LDCQRKFYIIFTKTCHDVNICHDYMGAAILIKVYLADSRLRIRGSFIGVSLVYDLYFGILCCVVVFA